MAKKKLYNHSFELAFSVLSTNPGGAATNEEILQGLQRRLNILRDNPNETQEAVEVFDSIIAKEPCTQEEVHKWKEDLNSNRGEFKGWEDENCQNPTKNGKYLCLIQMANSDNYQYAILEYDTKRKWNITNSCEHILWTELPTSPFSK